MDERAISLILPTWQAASWLPRLLHELKTQTRTPDEILVIDSSSDDQTAGMASAAGCVVEVIERTAFNHGATRNHAALLARGEALVFMTQDALPASADYLQALTEPIFTGAAAATYARQLPRPEATPLERFQRIYHYPERLDSHGSGRTGLKFRYFSSNSAAAVRRSAFVEVGGFPPRVPCSEDVALSAKLQRAGYATIYVPEAAVVHSHNLDVWRQFRRYFDTGAAYVQAQELLGEVRPNSDGRRYATALLAYLVREQEWHWLGHACLELMAKWAGYQLGRKQRYLPETWKPRLSQQPDYWRQGRSETWTADDPRVIAAQAIGRAAAAGTGNGAAGSSGNIS